MQIAAFALSLLLAFGPAGATVVRPELPTYQQPQPEIKAFTGTVIKNADKFLLSDSASKLSYVLDDRGKATPYEGKKVRITGTLDLATNTIHVDTIEEIA